MRRNHLLRISWEGEANLRRLPEIEREYQVALCDLLDDHHFVVKRLAQEKALGVNLTTQNNRLIFEITQSESSNKLLDIPVNLLAFRRIFRDYGIVCDNYFEAIKTASLTKIEAIDMGRRAIHNEGAELIQDLLSDDIEMDEPTARRLFTLLAIIQRRAGPSP